MLNNITFTIDINYYKSTWNNPLGSVDHKVKLRFLLNEFKILARWSDVFAQNVLSSHNDLSYSNETCHSRYSEDEYIRSADTLILYWLHLTLGRFECIMRYACSVSAFLWQVYFLLFDIYHCLQLSAFLRKWNTRREEIFVNYNAKVWNPLECNFRVACFQDKLCRIDVWIVSKYQVISPYSVRIWENTDQK